MVGAVLACVLLPSLAPEFFMVACPHHAGHGESTSHHVEGGQPPMEHDHDDGRSGAPADVPPCTCAGECPVTHGPDVAESSQTTEVPVLVVEASFRPLEGSDLRQSPLRFLQPPATAPPAP